MSVALHAPLRHLSVCAGYGGLDIALKLALGDGVRTVGYVERETAAAATLVARMEDQALDCAPVWDDVTTFPAADWRGCVDIVSAGFPCQPWSQAGKRAGIADKRWLWPSLLRLIVEVGAGFVFLENVPGLVTGHGLEHVLSGLAENGFDAVWTHIAAGDCGATQLRKRVFILAYRDERVPAQQNHALRARRKAFDNVRAANVAHGQRTGCREVSGAECPEGGADTTIISGKPGDLWPPGLPESDDDGDSLWKTWARIVDADWTLAPSLPQSALRRMADGAAGRVDRIRMLGNGVVPLQAAYAFCALLSAAEKLMNNS